MHMARTIVHYCLSHRSLLFNFQTKLKDLDLQNNFYARTHAHIFTYWPFYLLYEHERLEQTSADFVYSSLSCSKFWCILFLFYDYLPRLLFFDIIKNTVFVMLWLIDINGSNAWSKRIMKHFWVWNIMKSLSR
jgi:hypothetical protein